MQDIILQIVHLLLRLFFFKHIEKKQKGKNQREQCCSKKKPNREKIQTTHS